ncbi:hypothetical protein HHK36_006606 [Tetracentron sinense]|uniref:Pre-mRNA-processing protein 40C n=1 Tax=Tetracentron sinense TaxID=13715 RepID=A0A834ZJB2_TETSI|nr:hypothetical protein HHK36_006606 [Tetracentron sinense]
MSSPAWLPQEVQSSASGVTSQAPLGPPIAGPATAPPTPNAAHPAPVVGLPISKSSSDTASDTMQESVQAKYVTAPGYVIPTSSFSYSVLPKASTAPEITQQSSSIPVNGQVIKSNPPASAAALQPPVPGASSSTGPSFSYIISHDNVGSHSGHQFQSSTVIGSGHLQGGKTTPPTNAALLQPPVPGQPGHPNSFVRGPATQTMPPPIPSPVSVPKGAPSNASFSFNGVTGVSHLMQKDPPLNSVDSPGPKLARSGKTASGCPRQVLHQLDQYKVRFSAGSNVDTSAAVAQDARNVTPESSSSQSFPLHTHISSSSSITASTTLNLRPPTLLMPTSLSYPGLPRMPGTPGTPGPPGIDPSASFPSTVTVRPAAMDSSSSALLRSIMPSTSPVPSHPAVQQQIYPLYPSLPAMAPHPQGFWLQPPQIGGLPRPPFMPYPGVLPGTFPLAVRAMPLPSVPLPDSQPPGVTPLGPGEYPSAFVDSGHQLASSSGMQPDLPPPGIDNNTRINDLASKDRGSVNNEQIDAWTAHKTDAGAVYYYNAVTGESTYEKPSGFKGEPDKVTVQPTPVSWEKLAGTDWALVTTSDGKKYYYNTKTKVSSWQVPMEVTEMKKKQEGDTLKEHTVPVPNAKVLTEKGSAPISLSAPAVNTGGRDATALRPSGMLGSSSALDLIKKKLQDYGTPVTSSPLPASSGPTTSDLNGLGTVEATVKGLQSENSKDKLKDANGDGNLSDSSTDSEDVDSGPTKEECIIQFKEMLKERGVAPFSKWEKELPKIVFDPRFKEVGHKIGGPRVLNGEKSIQNAEPLIVMYVPRTAMQKGCCHIKGRGQTLSPLQKVHYVDDGVYPVLYNIVAAFAAAIPGYSDRRSLFEHFVRTRAEEERKEKRAAQKAALEGFKQLLEEASEEIDHKTNYQSFKKNWGNDPRFEALDRKERENLLNERVLPLKKAADEKIQAIRTAATSSFKSMLQDNGDITTSTRWYRVKDSLRNDPRYKSVKHEDREVLFNEYISELKAGEEEVERTAKAKREEQDKLKEREREMRKRKEREELEMVRVRLKVRRKEAVSSYQALLVETIKDPQASWNESKSKLEKDPQKRALNPDLDPADTEKLFREHAKILHELKSDPESKFTDAFVDFSDLYNQSCDPFLCFVDHCPNEQIAFSQEVLVPFPMESCRFSLFFNLAKALI